MNTQIIKRFFALLMSVTLLLSAVPAGVLAEAESAIKEQSTDSETILTDEYVNAEIFEQVTEQPAESPTDEPPSDDAVEETPVPDAENEALPNEPPSDEPSVPTDVKSAIAANGHVYIITAGAIKVYATSETPENAPLFTITQDGTILLATEYVPLENSANVKVWFMTTWNENISAYISADSLTILTDEEANAQAEALPCAWVSTDAGEMIAFVVAGEKVAVPTETPVGVVPSQDPTQEPSITEPIITEAPVEESTQDPVPEATEQPVSAEEPLSEEVPVPEPPSVLVGDYIAVTTATRVYPSVDETVTDEYDGDDCMDVFVCDAVVQVESVEQDSVGRCWLSVCYLYGDDFADGMLKWTNTETVYVLASETGETDTQYLTVTDYAFANVPRTFSLRSVTPMDGFSLKTINAPIPSFYVGLSGLYGSSGKDSEYLQIAKSSDHGTIYATPHYLDGFTVYCLEHNLSGPGENISGGGQQPKGPYMIVDIDSYRNTPGYSSIIYHDSTMHAIAWVLRHTYPFMALDRGDSDNEVWSRVAGQFAIRQVIRELEGAQYVRSYWNMDNFYRASGQAPAVYLEYARWLAANGIARGRITGNINVSGKSIVASGGSYVGTVTLTTDADLMRISKSVGSLSGNSAGSDGSYYYLNSGDTISVTSSKSSFTVKVESVSSADEEASFLVGVPSVEIQKVLIPQYGYPYKLKSVSVKFDVPMGSASVTKKDAQTGAALAGAVYELLNAAGSVIQMQTTGANGVAAFADLQPGSYTVREKSAPQGYTVAVTNTQNVTVTAGNVSSANFANDVMTAKIRIVKKDQLTKQPLSGVEFTVTRLSAPAGRNGVGEVVAVLTTDANGSAETGWLDYGRYRITETNVPPHFVDSHFSTEIEACENGKTYTVEVENEPTKGWLRLVKTDALDAAPIAGVTFDIYYNDEYGSGLAGSMTTDQKGVAVSPALRKGSYIVRERGNPVGYVSELVELNAVVRSDETSDLHATNQPIQGKIRIVKKDQLTKEALAGAEFTITRVSGPPSHNGSDNGTDVAVITTDAEGIAESPLLTWGTYSITETVVPPHFVDNHFSAQVIVDAENLQTYEIIAENEPTKGWIRLTKTDRKNGNPIEGVQFDIYYNDEYGEGLAATMVTGRDGIAVSEPLRKGRYIVREHGATAGYLFEEIALDATVKSDETTELHATNQPVQVKLKLYKRDAEEYNGDNPNSSARPKATSELPVTASVSAPVSRGDGVLTGAEFQVLAGDDVKDRQGYVVCEKGAVVIPSLKTEGEDASVTTGELWPALYEIVEVRPPVGYQPSDTHFFVDARSAATQSAEAVITYEGLKTNEILYGAFGIVKFTGDNEIHSDAGVIETPEKGAEFEVYLKCAGSYANARNVERDYLVTNKYGRATTKALPYGVYVLRQIVGKEGYAIMRPIDVMIDGTENLKDPPTLILNNQAIHYRLRIVKIDAETGKPVTLAGTSFKLKDADGNYIKQRVSYPTPMELDTFVTDESGEVTLPETVTWGQYFVEEVRSPEGYLLYAEAVEFFVGHTGDTVGEVYEVTVEVSNTPVKGNIVVEKKGLRLIGFEAMKDAYGNEYQHPIYEEGYLAGAVFEVYAAEAIISKDGTVWYEQDALVDTITTTAHGADASKLLPPGKYYLIETATPEGYAFDGSRHEAELAFADNQMPVVTVAVPVSNIFLPVEITLQKEKEIILPVHGNDGTVQQILIISEPGEGFVFGLYNSMDTHYDGGTLMADTLVATGVTGADGSLTFSGCYPHGDYYIKELSAPAGWKLNPNTFPVTLDPAAKAEDADVIRVALLEAVHDELIYTKVTLTKQDITGEKTLPGAQIEVRNDKGEVIYRATTDEHGQIPDIPVTPGTYTFREVLAPAGYALNEAEMTFTVDEHGNVSGDTVIRDDYTRVTLLKQNENSLPLAGVEFALRKADGTTLMTATSDEIGLVTFEKIPFGSYTIVETAPPKGYLKSEVSAQLTIDGTFVNADKPIETIVNLPNEIVLKKVDSEGKPLAGASFALLNAYGAQIMAAVSDANGMVRFTKIPYGSYTLRETQAPDGYSPMEDIQLTVDASQTKPIEYTCVNIPNHYEFIKVDNRGNPLAGVKFVLEDGEGDYLRNLVSGDDGVVHVNDLMPGSYTIRETEVLEGFNKSDEIITLVIDEHYVVPAELYRFVNYSGIQTGFEMEMTPVMWVGVGLMLTAAVSLAAHGLKRKGKKRRK